MLVEKYGTASFLVRDPDTGVEQELEPDDLTDVQRLFMAYQPDMVLQYAHLLRERFRAESGRAPEVRVRCHVMLNGRPSEPLIDPTVDLAREAPGWRPKDWLLPSPRELAIIPRP